MDQLTKQTQQILREKLQPGDVAIDATAGNGHDTLFLAQTVGPSGIVYAFDVQDTAIEQTQSRLEAAGAGNVKLIQESHAEMASFIAPEHHGQIAAVMFNLGYLPGSDKRNTTQPATTCRAIDSAISLLADGGVLSVLAYTGHPGGMEEAVVARELLESYRDQGFSLMTTIPERPRAPHLFIVKHEPRIG